MFFSDSFVINNGVLEKYLNEYTVDYLHIPYGVKEIGDYAFFCCETVKVIFLPETVERIGKNAFCKCVSLVGIHVLGKLKSVGACAFDCCRNLKWVNISDISSWCGVSFENGEANPLSGEKTLLYINTVLVKELVIPDGVGCVADYVFRNCENLQSVTVPGSVTEIGNYAFSECLKLKTVVLSVTRIIRTTP